MPAMYVVFSFAVFKVPLEWWTTHSSMDLSWCEFLTWLPEVLVKLVLTLVLSAPIQGKVPLVIFGMLPVRDLGDDVGCEHAGWNE